MKILNEQYPYRYCESDNNDKGWIEKYDWQTKRYKKIYECDSSLQLMTAIEDFDYTLWLDNQPCYRGRRGDSVKAYATYL